MNKKTTIIILIIIQIFFFTIMIYSGKKIYIWNKENKNTKQMIENINDNIQIDCIGEKENSNSINWDWLKKQNNETVGWLKINGTDINYPVVKHDNNSFYLNHSLDMSNNNSGWIFLDYRNNLDGMDKNIIIYGHNRKDGSMLGNLKNTLNKDWYENKENLKILFLQQEKENIYQVFSIYKIKKEEYYITTDFTSENYSIFLQKIKNRSIYDFKEELNECNQIITLSTCDSNNNYRIVLHAYKVEF